MSTKDSAQRESDENTPNREESNTENNNQSFQVSNFLLSLQGVFVALFVLLVVGSAIVVIRYDMNLLSISFGLAAVGGFLFGVCLTGFGLERRKKKALQDCQREINDIESKIDQLAAVTSTGDRAAATDNKLELLITAAKGGELGEHSGRGQRLGKTGGDSKQKDHSVDAVLNQMDPHRFPPENTPARNLISQIQAYKDPGSLKDAVEDLKDQSEDFQLLKETFASANEKISVSRDPTTNEFTASLEALETAYDSLDTQPGDRTPTLGREHTKNFVKSHKKTVKNFQSYFDRHQTDDSEINLKAASQIEADSTVNLPLGSTAKRLIADLQNQEDGSQIEDRLRQAIDELNSYRSVQSSLDTEEELKQELESLSESTDSLQGPVADILQQKVDAVEQLFSKTSLSQMDDVQRISLQERINVLADIVAELDQISQYQDSTLSEELESLDQEIEDFLSRYIDSREWNHYNHSISNQYVSLAQEFHANASEAAGRDDTRARAFVEAGRRTLELTEQLYQKPKFTSLLDPTID